MTNVRIGVLALLAAFPAAGQSVVSTHSGVVYFFAGTVFIGDQKLEQKFGRFPDIGEGRELRTETGRAEVLLTPGVILRVAENSTIRMLSNKLADTQVELLSGSAILESNDPPKDTAVTLIHKKWQMRLPRPGVYRIDSTPPHVQVFKGEVEVAAEGQKDKVPVKEGETLPLADVLLTDRSTAPDSDSFKAWAMNRSQAIASDNATAAEIIDDPNQFDTASGLASGGFTYFPPTGMPSLGIGNPYGLSFWSPYQPTLAAIWNPVYLYGAYGPVYGPGYGTLHSGWPSVYRPSPNPIYSPRPIYSRPIGPGWHPVGANAPRPIYTAPPRTYSHSAPQVGTHPGATHAGAAHR
jgi:hypothetical protein